MRRTYPLKHWALTLLIAPFTSQVIEYIFGTSPDNVIGLLEVYPITLLFSIVFSLPTLVTYLICFYILSMQDVKWRISKLILIAVSITGIYITMTVAKGSISRDIIIAYSVTSLIVGLLLKLKGPIIETND